MTRARSCFGMLGLAWTLSMSGTEPTVLPPQGGEQAIVGRMPGDQVHSHLALTASGGYLVWEENTGENGAWMVLGEPLTAGFKGAGAATIMPVSLGVAGDSQNAQTALLRDGGKVVVWQGGQVSFQKVYARFITAGNQFATAPIQVNTYTNNEQINPVVAVLPDGGVFVAWTSIGQDGDKAGVFARRLDASGQFAGAEFQVNQFTDWNQRDPSVTVLNDGTVAVAWVSEQQRGARYVDVYARLFHAAGDPATDELLLNDTTNICANPVIAPIAGGGFTAAWSQQDIGVTTNGWDIYARAFDGTGVGVQASARINAYTYGDQFGPKIAASGANHLAVWTSMLQDGSFEGIFGRVLDTSARPVGDEFLVNTTTVSRQIHPAVAGTGAGQVVAVWSSYAMGPNSMDLFAQIYGNVSTVDPRLSLVAETQGWRLEWTTQVGTAYQVQVSANFDSWTNVGGPRTAAGDTDSMVLTPADGAAYYRIVILP